MEPWEIEGFERNRIAELLSRLLEQEKFTNMKGERSKLWDSEDRSQNYTVLDRLDILCADIIGYVSGITSKPYPIKEPEKVINHLYRLSIFNVECIMNWYPSVAEEYPKIKQYFELLDYVRLLTINYIQRYQLLETTAK
jgi:hypothetical protein